MIALDFPKHMEFRRHRTIVTHDKKFGRTQFDGWKIPVTTVFLIRFIEQPDR